jgi:HAMP domain-containing protein
MRIVAVALSVCLVVVTVWLGSAVIRLENYREANLVGMCNHYNITDPIQRIQREDCLMKAKTRTHWFWHLLHGIGIV